MRMADLFPPGRVLWAVRDCDLHPSHQSQEPTKDPDQTLRLFEVLDVEKVFSQIIFSRNMLGCVLTNTGRQHAHAPF